MGDDPAPHYLHYHKCFLAFQLHFWCSALKRLCVSEQSGVLFQRSVATHSVGVTHIRASSGFLPRISSRILIALCNRVQKPETQTTGIYRIKLMFKTVLFSGHKNIKNIFNLLEITAYFYTQNTHWCILISYSGSLECLTWQGAAVWPSEGCDSGSTPVTHTGVMQLTQVLQEGKSSDGLKPHGVSWLWEFLWPRFYLRTKFNLQKHKPIIPQTEQTGTGEQWGVPTQYWSTTMLQKAGWESPSVWGAPPISKYIQKTNIILYVKL